MSRNAPLDVVVICTNGGFPNKIVFSAEKIVDVERIISTSTTVRRDRVIMTKFQIKLKGEADKVYVLEHDQIKHTWTLS